MNQIALYQSPYLVLSLKRCCIVETKVQRCLYQQTAPILNIPPAHPYLLLMVYWLHTLRGTGVPSNVSSSSNMSETLPPYLYIPTIYIYTSAPSILLSIMTIILDIFVIKFYRRR